MSALAAVCSVEECDRRAYAYGICEMHYKRWQRHGTTDRVGGKPWTDEQVAELRRTYEAAPPPAMLPPAAELVERLGHSMRSISAKARALGLTNGQRQTSPKTVPDRDCAHCGTTFSTDMDSQRCCSQSCAGKHRIATEGHPRHMAGKKHGESTRAQIGEKSKAAWDAMTPAERKAQMAPMHAAPKPPPSGNTFSRTRSGKRADLGGLFVRSAWEANYARILNARQERGEIAGWRYEPRTFEFPVKRGNKSYTPDFEVTLPDGSIEWHEVKGWMTKDSKIKLRRFALHHPAETLVLVDERAYRALAKEWADQLPEWER